MPSPWWTAERLAEQVSQGYERIDVYLNGPYFAPFDPSREVIGAMQFDAQLDVDAVLAAAARRWTSTTQADEELVQVWPEPSAPPQNSLDRSA